jgi:hypothetical protein
MESTCAARCGASLPHWAQPGCPGRFALGKAEPACLPTMGLAALRCCGATKAGRPSCVSVCHVDAAGSYGWVDKTPWSVEEMEPLTLEGSRGLEETHAAATGECLARGMRLCTKTELVDGRQCCGLGCNMDPKLVWTAETCPASACEAHCRAYEGMRVMRPANYDAMVCYDGSLVSYDA